ncbi:vegetative cell wall protein gp1-like [Zingiber officinale]|uniref:vegetative cell wall protein gp1-like n=1 Tax=Zingiber officinale TaxID=94328 RepID=UPI001C4CF4C7|nr:vegetative cell wall protein gp1-like [Zingiber officinale]
MPGPGCLRCPRHQPSRTLIASCPHDVVPYSSEPPHASMPPSPPPTPPSPFSPASYHSPYLSLAPRSNPRGLLYSFLSLPTGTGRGSFSPSRSSPMLAAIPFLSSSHPSPTLPAASASASRGFQRPPAPPASHVPPLEAAATGTSRCSHCRSRLRPLASSSRATTTTAVFGGQRLRRPAPSPLVATAIVADTSEQHRHPPSNRLPRAHVSYYAYIPACEPRMDDPESSAILMALMAFDEYIVSSSTGIWELRN